MNEVCMSCNHSLAEKNPNSEIQKQKLIKNYTYRINPKTLVQKT